MVREMALLADVHLISQVADDVGQVLVEGALEAAGVVGIDKGQVPPHRCLFCSTNEGKVAIVRQLEPELHLDGSATTVNDLRRFIPALVHVGAGGGAAGAAANVAPARSLAAFMGL
ncbi:hypothetical protein FOA52_015145 [Chlamydomonas sp. UWO 241]|nr:hypothetical protein FOA52_015145 [Chlamydomonas sp. UWO 241]